MDTDFARFWAACRRKVAKLDAEKAWRQVLARGYDANEIIAGMEKFAALCIREGREMQFIPHPATWLRAGRWMDEELNETIKPAPLVKPAGSVQEVIEYRRSKALPITAEIQHARSVNDLPAMARMVPIDWRAN